MKHLNLAEFRFAEQQFTRTNRYGRRYGSVPVWSYYRSMEWYGHAVGVYFIVPVPREITPVRVDPGDKVSPRVLAADSFNVVLPFKIVPAVYAQDGTLIFGEVDFVSKHAWVAEGRENILASQANRFYSNKSFVFVALWRYPQSMYQLKVCLL